VSATGNSKISPTIACQNPSTNRRAAPGRKVDAKFFAMQVQIASLRSLSDKEDDRASCVTYLQQWLIHFHPERPDIVAQMSAMAKELGGTLHTPRLPWKYRWLEVFLGLHWAKVVQMKLRDGKCLLLSGWDRMLLRIENRRLVQ